MKLSITRAIALLFWLIAGEPTGLQCWGQASGPKYDRLRAEVEKTFGDPQGMIRLDPQSRIWADKKNRRVVVDGYIALREGQLEMLACTEGTKEHESIVAVLSKAQLVHAGLLAVGAKQGKPVQWEPEYQPPSGSEIKVIALWKDEQGEKHAIDARQWVREVGTDDKVLDTNFVFAGSSMWTDPATGEEHYQAEAGDLICVANFSTATLDVPLRSLPAREILSFSAFTSRIPPPGTPVRLVLEVVDEPAKAVSPAEDDVPAPSSAEPNDSSQATQRSTNILAGYEKLIESPAADTPPPTSPSQPASTP